MSPLRPFTPSRWRLVSTGVLLAAGIVQAQGLPDPAQMMAGFQKQQQANEQILRQYTWKARTEVRVGGEVKSNMLQMVRYDATGALQKTVIGGEKAPERTRPLQKTPIGALVGGIKKKKTQEYNDDLRELLDAYATIPPDSMRQYFQNAAFQPGQDAMHGCIRIAGTDVVRPKDRMSIWMDPQTREKRRLEIATELNGDDVQIVSQFGKLPGGADYTRLTTVEIKDKKLQLITENFDFTRVNVP